MQFVTISKSKCYETKSRIILLFALATDCTWSRHGRFWHENYGRNNEVWECRGLKRQRKVTMKLYSIFRNKPNHLREVEQTACKKLHILHCSFGWLFGALLFVVATNVSMKLHTNVVRKQHAFRANKRDYLEFAWLYAGFEEAGWGGGRESMAIVITQRQLHCSLVFLVGTWSNSESVALLEITTTIFALAQHAAHRRSLPFGCAAHAERAYLLCDAFAERNEYPQFWRWAHDDWDDK